MPLVCDGPLARLVAVLGIDPAAELPPDEAAEGPFEGCSVCVFVSTAANRPSGAIDTD